jgi:hypothetical protein
MYEVTKSNDIDMPIFTSDEIRNNYIENFVAGEIQWKTQNEFVRNGLIGPMTFNDKQDYDWYETAYGDTKIQILCNLVEKQDYDNIQEFLNNHTDKEELVSMLNSRDIISRNPLHISIKKNNLTIAKLLLDAGSTPMCISKLGKTALHQVCESGSIEMLQLLSQYGKVNYNIADSYRMTPIVSSIVYDNFPVFEYMLNNSLVKQNEIIWIFKYDKSLSYRALNLCVQFNRPKFMEYLLDIQNYDPDDYYFVDNKKYKHIMNTLLNSYNVTMIEIMMKHLQHIKFKISNIVMDNRLYDNLSYFYRYVGTDDEYLFENIIQSIRLYTEITNIDINNHIKNMINQLMKGWKLLDEILTNANYINCKNISTIIILCILS